MLKMGQGAVHSLQILYHLKHQALLNINLDEDILSFYPAWRPFVAPIVECGRKAVRVKAPVHPHLMSARKGGTRQILY